MATRIVNGKIEFDPHDWKGMDELMSRHSEFDHTLLVKTKKARRLEFQLTKITSRWKPGSLMDG